MSLTIFDHETNSHESKIVQFNTSNLHSFQYQVIKNYDYSESISSFNAEVVVSDGLTNNDLNETKNEIQPGVTIYRFNNNNHPFFKYLFAEKIENADVYFYIKNNESEWIQLNEEPLTTDSEGKAYLPLLRSLVPIEIINQAPIDLKLKAVAKLSDGTEVYDDQGLIRILDKNSDKNPSIVAVDHDNTLHATGGLNAAIDIIRFINWATDEWPVVDDFVQDAIDQLSSNNTDVIIVTGLPNPLRNLCREQVNLHFENNETRFIPMIIKSDANYEHSNDFKAATLGIIKKLYGEENFISMVGDTVRQDGYGAYANQLRYIPYQIHYRANTDLLDTEGYGFIDPSEIAIDWGEVMDYLFEEGESTNFFLQNTHDMLNIAHRGGGNLRPENTILCYQYALQVGADVLEGDLHSTKDGVIMVSHDATVDRCTNGSGEIKNYYFDDLRKLDAGYWFTTDGGESFPYRDYSFNGVDHLQIPTLKEVFSDEIICKAPMILEIKQQNPSIVDPVLDLIEQYDMEHKVVIGSFDKESLIEIREKSELRGMNIITSFSEEEVLDFYLTLLPSIIKGSYIPPGSILQVPIEYELNGITVPVVTPFFMNKARYLGLKIQVWTINDTDEMQWLLEDVNVDGIMTDNPEVLENIIME